MTPHPDTQQLLERISTLSRPRTPEAPEGVEPRITALPEIHSVVFDVYGTLLASGIGEVSVAESARIDALEALLERFFPEKAIAGEALAEALRAAIRESHERSRADGIAVPEVEIRDIWRRTLNAVGLDVPKSASPDEIALEYELRANPVWPMPGAVETVRALARAGFETGIISNAQFYTPLILRALFPPDVYSSLVATAVWSFETGEAKPSPTLFDRYRAAARSAVPPDRCLYVGNDMLNDVQGAHDAGFQTALFSGDRHSLRLRTGHRSVTAAPDIIIGQLGDILSVVQKG